MIWAHNVHIQYDYGEQSYQNMGDWLVQNFRSQLYTIGLFMYEGQAAMTNREIYDIKNPRPNGLEAIFNCTETDFSFLDLLAQVCQPGNSWIFESVSFKSWGLYADSMIPRDQYDAILFIKTVHPPHYL